MTSKRAYKLFRFLLSVRIIYIALLAVIFNIFISWLIAQIPFFQSLAPDESINKLANDVGPVVFFFFAVALILFLKRHFSKHLLLS